MSYMQPVCEGAGHQRTPHTHLHARTHACGHPLPDYCCAEYMCPNACLRRYSTCAPLLGTWVFLFASSTKSKDGGGASHSPCEIACATWAD